MPVLSTQTHSIRKRKREKSSFTTIYTGIEDRSNRKIIGKTITYNARGQNLLIGKSLEDFCFFQPSGLLEPSLVRDKAQRVNAVGQQKKGLEWLQQCLVCLQAARGACCRTDQKLIILLVGALRCSVSRLPTVETCTSEASVLPKKTVTKCYCMECLVITIEYRWTRPFY